MSSIGSDRRRRRGASPVTRAGWALMLALAALCMTATAASALTVNIVGPGEAPEKLPPKVKFFKSIQGAVNASSANGWVLIEPGVYTEEVKITGAQHGITLRGMNRNEVILDGQNKPLPGGSNGIEVFKTSNVWIENLTVRNFDRASESGPNGNEIWWNGGGDTGKIGAHGWYGKYLTAYDTGLNGGYGIFTGNERKGEWENIYASGFNDSGIYIGACPECEAVVNKATMENNSLGYSGSNAGGQLIIENSLFAKNTSGVAPNSENPGDAPPPQNGACLASLHKHPLPIIPTTTIARCTIIRNNIINENGNLSAPGNPSTKKAPYGAGVQLPGDYGDLIEGNTITNNPTNGVLAYEYPNPFPLEEKTIDFQLAGNKIANNSFLGNGTFGGKFSGDVAMSGGLFGTRMSVNNCLSGNSFTAAVYPENIEGTWGCQHETTPNPELGVEGIEYLLTLQAISEARTPAPQAAPPAQPTMPNPCEGVPIKNPVCP